MFIMTSIVYDAITPINFHVTRLDVARELILRRFLEDPIRILKKKLISIKHIK